MDYVARKETHFWHILLGNEKCAKRQWRGQETDWCWMQRYFSVSFIVECDQEPLTVVKQVDLVHERARCTHFFVSSGHHSNQVVNQDDVKHEHLEQDNEHCLDTIGAVAKVVVKVYHTVEHLD